MRNGSSAIDPFCFSAVLLGELQTTHAAFDERLQLGGFALDRVIGDAAADYFAIKDAALARSILRTIFEPLAA